MQSSIVTALVFCCLIAGAAPALGAEPEAAKQEIAAVSAKKVSGDAVIAKVNDAEIYASDLVLLYQDLPAQYRQVPLAEMYAQLLARLIDRKLLANAGRSGGLLEDNATVRRLQFVSDGVLQESFARQQVDKAITEKKLRAAYAALEVKLKGEEEIEARHILVRTKEEGDAVIRDLKGGADFLTLAKQRSIDPSKSDGGMLGFFQRGQMVPEFEAAAFKLKPNEVSQAPVQSEFGWHVIRLESRRPAPVPTFEESEPQLRAGQVDGAIETLIASLRKGAKIEEFPPEGLPGPEGKGAAKKTQ